MFRENMMTEAMDATCLPRLSCYASTSLLR
jgi:hypothetical protein